MGGAFLGRINGLTSIDHACTVSGKAAIIGDEAGGGSIIAGQTEMADMGVREALVRVLREGVDVHRCLAARALGRCGDAEAVEPLIAALLDEDEDVRTDAADALLRLGEERAAKPLLENLIGDPCSEVKLAAIDAIGRFRPAAALPILRGLVGERTDTIVWDEEEIFQTEWDSWADLQPKAITALAAYGDRESVPLIVDALNDVDGQDLRGVGFDALSRLGDDGVEALAGFLDSPDERTRIRAAGHIAQLNGAVADRAILRAFEDSSVEVVLAAAAALAGRDPHDRRLAALLDDPRPQIRAEMVRLCGAAHAGRLEGWLADKNMAVRTAALRLIAARPRLVDRTAGIDLVRANLGGTPIGVLSAAAEAISSLSPKNAREALVEIVVMTELAVEARVTVLRVLSRIATNATVPTLKTLIGAAHRPIRIEAMAALAKLAGRSRAKINRAERVLIAALNAELIAPPPVEDTEAVSADDGEGAAADDTDDDTQGIEEPSVPTSTLEAIMGNSAAAVETTENSDVDLSEEDVEYLRLAARKGGKRRVATEASIALYDDVPRTAARLLGEVPHDDSIAALAEALGSHDREVREAAADSLARIADLRGTLPDMAADALLRALPGTERELRPGVVRALGGVRRGANKVVMALIGMLDDEVHLVRIEAIRALARHGEIGPGVAGLLVDPEPGVRMAAAAALANSDGAEWLDRMAEMAFENEGYHRRDVPRLLRGIDRGRANAAFLEVLDDQARRREWAVAIEALEELNQRPNNAPGTAIG